MKKNSYFVLEKKEKYVTTMYQDKKMGSKIFHIYNYVHTNTHKRGFIFMNMAKNMFPSIFPTKFTNPLIRVADIHIVLIQICNKRTFKTSCLFSVFLVLEIPNYNIIQSKLVSLQSNRVSQNFSIS